jgi:RNA polymerase sigma-70 factor (ECF subfamily)
LEKFDNIYQQHYATVFRLVAKFTFGSHETDDIVQDVFVKLYLQMESGVIVEYPKTWLYKVATNACLNSISRNKENHSIENVGHLEVNMADSIDAKIENEEQHRMLQNALLRLKDSERAIVILYSEGLSYKEMAEATGVRFSSIGKILSRSLEKLKPLLKNQYYEMLNR